MNVQHLGKALGKVVFTVGTFVAVCAMAQDAEYVSNSKCKMCHNKVSEGEQWKKWTETKHAKAYESLLTSDNAKEYTEARGLTTAPAETPECLRCHVTGYDAEKETFVSALKKENGIQCNSCHGPGSEHLAFGKKMMMKKDEIDDSMDMKILIPNVKTCLKCHNDESPTWDPEKYTLEDGTKAGFDFEQAFATIAHFNPKKKRD